MNSTEFLNVLHKVVVDYNQPYLTGVISKKEIENFKSNNNEKNRFTTKNYNYQSLERIIKKLEGKSKIVFLSTPLSPVVFEIFDNEYKNWINTLKRELIKNKKFYDLSNSIDNNNFFL